MTESSERRVWAILRSRTINVRSMDARLRAITLTAVVSLLATTVLTAGRHLPMPAAPTLDINAQPVTVPAPVLFAALALVGMGLGWLLAGALHSWWPLRAAAAAGWLALCLLGPSPTPASGALEAGIGAAGALLAAASVAADRRSAVAVRPARLDPVRTIIASLLLPALYAGLWAQGRSGGRSVLATVFSWQLGKLGWALIPVLILAGVDFADWAEVGAERAAALAGRLPRPVLPLLAAAIALAILLPIAISAGVQPLLLIELGLALLLVIPLLALGLASARWRRLPRRIPYAALAAFALIYLAVSYATARAWEPASAHAWTHRNLGPYEAATYSSAEPTTFSLDYPKTWTVDGRSDTADWAAAGFHDPATRAEFTALVSIQATYTPRTDAAGYLRSLCSNCRQTLTRLEPQSRWEVTQFVLRRPDNATLTGAVFTGYEQNHSLIAAGLAPSRNYPSLLPVFRRMAATLTPAAAPPGIPAVVESVYYGSYDAADALRGAAYLVAAALLVLAVVMARRRAHRALVAAALFGCGAAIFYSLETLRPMAAILLHVPKRAVPFMGRDGLQSSIAILSLLVIGWIGLRRRSERRARRVVAQLLALNVGLQILVWIYVLYYRAADLGGRISLVQALFILAALAWDVALSGETITNADGRRLPRPGRLLMFFGYIVLVAAAVMYGSALSSDSGTALSPQLDSDGWAMYGLLFIGAPILLVHAGIGLAAILTGQGREPGLELETA